MCTLKRRIKLRLLCLEGIEEAIKQFYLIADVDPAHNWEHIERVIVNSIRILETEGKDTSTVLNFPSAVLRIDKDYKWTGNFVRLIAMCHDLNDHKLISNLAYLRQRDRLMSSIEGTIAIFFKAYGLSLKSPEHFIYKIVDQISWSKNKCNKVIVDFTKNETMRSLIEVAVHIVRDADRLESTGITGLFRAIEYARHNKGSTSAGVIHFFNKQDSFMIGGEAFTTATAKESFKTTLPWLELTKQNFKFTYS